MGSAKERYCTIKFYAIHLRRIFDQRQKMYAPVKAGAEKSR
jgi:hypothetical protein